MGDEATQQYAKVDPKTGLMDPPADRPTGVTILAMLYFIMAGVTVIQILVTIFWGIIEWEWGVVCCAVPFFLVALFYFMIGTGIYLMMKWAWFWALLLAIFGLLFAIGNLFSAWYYDEWYPEGVPWYIYAIPAIQLIFNILILLYLFKMKESFREADPKQMQQMQVQMMEKQLQQMKKQQGEEPKKESTEDEHKESGGGESEGGDE